MIPSADTVAPTSTEGGDSRLPLRVLVVDDEPAILFAYRKLMEGEGIGVDTSTTLAGAMEHVRARPYLAVITDLRLAGTDNMDGLEVLRRIRQDRPEARLICATGYGSCETEHLVRELGASHYFEKPVVPSVIIGLLKQMANALTVTGATSCSLLVPLWALWN